MVPQIFTAPEGSQIRVVVRDGDPWFVASDVCKALDIGDTSNAVRGNPTRGDGGIDEDERGTCTVSTSAGSREALVVSEAGFYSLVFKSRKPEAKAFKRWVTHDVLPSIRKSGGYQLAPTSRLELARMLLEAEEKAEAKAMELEAARPAIEFHERVAQAQGEFGITEAAMEVGVKVPDFVQGLLDRGYVKRTGKHGPEKKGKLEPTHYSIKMGYMAIRMTVVRGVAYPEAVFLPRGIQWAVKLFKRAA